MFSPTHMLVSAAKQTPVRVVRGPQGFFLVTEQEWKQGRKPLFEIRPKRRFFCNGIQVLGYSLQPLATQAKSTESEPTATVA